MIPMTWARFGYTTARMNQNYINYPPLQHHPIFREFNWNDVVDGCTCGWSRSFCFIKIFNRILLSRFEFFCQIFEHVTFVRWVSVSSNDDDENVRGICVNRKQKNVMHWCSIAFSYVPFTIDDEPELLACWSFPRSFQCFLRDGIPLWCKQNFRSFKHSRPEPFRADLHWCKLKLTQFISAVLSKFLFSGF